MLSDTFDFSLTAKAYKNSRAQKFLCLVDNIMENHVTKYLFDEEVSYLNLFGIDVKTEGDLPMQRITIQNPIDIGSNIPAFLLIHLTLKTRDGLFSSHNKKLALDHLNQIALSSPISKLQSQIHEIFGRSARAVSGCIPLIETLLLPANVEFAKIHLPIAESLILQTGKLELDRILAAAFPKIQSYFVLSMLI